MTMKNPLLDCSHHTLQTRALFITERQVKPVWIDKEEGVLKIEKQIKCNGDFQESDFVDRVYSSPRYYFHISFLQTC